MPNRYETISCLFFPEVTAGQGSSSAVPACLRQGPARRGMEVQEVQLGTARRSAGRGLRCWEGTGDPGDPPVPPSLPWKCLLVPMMGMRSNCRVREKDSNLHKQPVCELVAEPQLLAAGTVSPHTLPLPQLRAHPNPNPQPLCPWGQHGPPCHSFCDGGAGSTASLSLCLLPLFWRGSAFQ